MELLVIHVVLIPTFMSSMLIKYHSHKCLYASPDSAQYVATSSVEETAGCAAIVKRNETADMPLPSRLMVRFSFVYLIVGFILGATLLIHKAFPLFPGIWHLLAIHIEMLIFGWITANAWYGLQDFAKSELSRQIVISIGRRSYPKH